MSVKADAIDPEFSAIPLASPGRSSIRSVTRNGPPQPAPESHLFLAGSAAPRRNTMIKPTFEIGGRVDHGQFGPGAVIGSIGECPRSHRRQRRKPRPLGQPSYRYSIQTRMRANCDFGISRVIRCSESTDAFSSSRSRFGRADVEGCPCSRYSERYEVKKALSWLGPLYCHPPLRPQHTGCAWSKTPGTRAILNGSHSPIPRAAGGRRYDHIGPRPC
jgi:hypothetical protein